MHTSLYVLDAAVFDANLAAWKREQNTPWGKLRRSICQRNLTRHIPDQGLDILDAGGGNGRDSIPLARQGHRVTIVDLSSQMLADARAMARRQGVPGRLLTLVEADVGAIPNRGRAPLITW